VKTVGIHRAEPINGHGGEPTVISITELAPAFGPIGEVEVAVALWTEQGKRLADALYDSLPGGTLDALLAELFRRRASLFRVGFSLPEEAQP
jgi:hypothetical protein